MEHHDDGRRISCDKSFNTVPIAARPPADAPITITVRMGRSWAPSALRGLWERIVSSQHRHAVCQYLFTTSYAPCPLIGQGPKYPI